MSNARVQLSNGGQLGRVQSVGSRKGCVMVRWCLTGTYTWERVSDLVIA